MLRRTHFEVGVMREVLLNTHPRGFVGEADFTVPMCHLSNWPDLAGRGRTTPSRERALAGAASFSACFPLLVAVLA